MDVIWVKQEAENFLKSDWTRGITLICFNKFRRARIAEGLEDGPQPDFLPLHARARFFSKIKS